MNLDTSEMYMKPGALDAPIRETYVRYQYKFLNQYRITHDFILGGGCEYRGKPVGINNVLPGKNYAPFTAKDIFETGEHTYIDVYLKNASTPINIDRYVRPEWQMGPDRDGQYRTVKGFAPMCAEAWLSTQHFLTVYLNKRVLNKPNVYGLDGGVISHQVVGKNNWWVQTFDLAPYRSNGAGRLVESWVLPIHETGYVLVFEFGANQDSLKHPQTHAQMQAIFRHLIESVKIEPLP